MVLDNQNAKLTGPDQGFLFSSLVLIRTGPLLRMCNWGGGGAYFAWDLGEVPVGMSVSLQLPTYCIYALFNCNTYIQWS
jgi:hypothetical protein